MATPTPTYFDTQETEEEVINKVIDGTLGILKSCLNSTTVKRVVYTSSSAAVMFSDNNAQVTDESCWSDVDYIKTLKSFASLYWISKTLVEKRALEFAQEHGLDLVTVIPPFIVGPFICPNLPTSVEAALAMIFGKYYCGPNWRSHRSGGDSNTIEPKFIDIFYDNFICDACSN